MIAADYLMQRVHALRRNFILTGNSNTKNPEGDPWWVGNFSLHPRNNRLFAMEVQRWLVTDMTEHELTGAQTYNIKLGLQSIKP